MNNEAMPIYQIAIVATVHIQPSKEWVKSLQSISSGKGNVKVIIVDDSDGKVELPSEFDVYGYERQRQELGDEAYAFFERFHKSSSCKNFGHWLAWRDRFDIVMGIDSDCIVPPNFIGEHIEALLRESYGWTNTLSNTRWFPRGYPYAQRNLRTVLSLGLWNRELDLYGKDRVENLGQQTSEPWISGHHVADGFIPLSGMNWACWSDAIPGLLFLPNFDVIHGDKTFKMRRHDDIWGGYIFQKMMCNRNERIVYGSPIVSHDTVVDAAKDAEEENGMILWENNFYGAVDQLFAEEPIEWGNYEDMMDVLSERATRLWKDTEWKPIAEALEFWFSLFDTTERI